MYNIMYETSRQSRFDARYWMLGAGALGRLRGRVWGGRREEGSGWGTHVYLWRIHFDIVKFKNKIKNKKIKPPDNSVFKRVNCELHICKLYLSKAVTQIKTNSWMLGEGIVKDFGKVMCVHCCI